MEISSGLLKENSKKGKTMERKLLTIENAKIIFRNFSGKKSEFNRDGDRNFAVIIEDPQMAKSLTKDGWNVKQLKQKDPDEVPPYYISVAVRYGTRPPKIYLVAGKKPTLMSEENVGTLDFAEIVNVDLTINPYHWEANGKQGVKAYLNTMYVTIEDDPFRSKYDSIDDIDDDLPF